MNYGIINKYANAIFRKYDSMHEKYESQKNTPFILIDLKFSDRKKKTYAYVQFFGAKECPKAPVADIVSDEELLLGFCHSDMLKIIHAHLSDQILANNEQANGTLEIAFCKCVDEKPLYNITSCVDGSLCYYNMGLLEIVEHNLLNQLTSQSLKILINNFSSADGSDATVHHRKSIEKVIQFRSDKSSLKNGSSR